MGANANSQQKFDFEYLFRVSQNQTVTYDICVEAVGTGVNWYNRQDVYDRVLLWRVPLLALWLNDYNSSIRISHTTIHPRPSDR